MILFIDTTTKNKIILELRKKIILEFEKIVEQSLKSTTLVQVINEFLQKEKVEKGSIEKIIVKNDGGGFTALRVGVTVANALAYALGINVDGTIEDKKNVVDGIKIVEPVY